jgi:hypothetical protein
MVANRSREGEATRFSFVDYRERKKALGIARLIRRAIVDALEETKKGRRGKVDRKKGGWVVTWDPPFSQIRRYVNGTRKKRSTSKKHRRVRERNARLIRFPELKAKV